MEMLDESPYDDSIYPDLDETTSFPWLIDDEITPDNFPTSSRRGPIVHEGFVPEDGYEDSDDDMPSGDIEDQSSVGDGEYGLQLVQDYNDPTVDPDYHISDHSAISEDEMSSAESMLEPGYEEEQAPTLGRGGSGRGSHASRGRGRPQRNPYTQKTRNPGRGGKGIKRGPRKPLEPSHEFKILHSEAASAFIDHDYERAVDLVQQAIQINPEMFAAHSLLSEIFLAQGQKEKALTALFSGAHTRPKDPTIWTKVAKLILEVAGDDRTSALNDVIYCYSRIIEIDQKNYNVRFQRATLNRELGHNGKALTEYERLLKDLPHDTRTLRHLAEIYIDLNEIEKAKMQYEASIQYYQSLDLQEGTDFTWSDVNIYVELYSYVDEYAAGIHALKSLSRWLLGRKADTKWDLVQADDREWDMENSPRRIEVPGFTPGEHSSAAYGLGLPLELRVKLGIYRLKLGDSHRDEAIAHFEWLDPEDNLPGAKLFDYADLFREAADSLKDAALHEVALRFYEPLQQTSEHADVAFFMSMGQCFRACGKTDEAIDCYQTIILYDDKNIEARLCLAKVYEELKMSEEAFKYINEAVLLGRQETQKSRRRYDKKTQNEVKALKSKIASSQVPAKVSQQTKTEMKDMAVKKGSTKNRTPSKSIRLPNAASQAMESPLETTTPAIPAIPTTLMTPPTKSRKRTTEEEREALRNDRIQLLYLKLQNLHLPMRAGDEDATEEWLDAADALLRDFRSNRVFYPHEKHMRFLGYTLEARKKAFRPKHEKMMDDAEQMADRLQVSLKNSDCPAKNAAIPTHYRSIGFDHWLNIFLEYALVLAGQDEKDEAYEIITAASDCSIWFHSKPKMLHINVCWFTCALRLNDEETLCTSARWFMREYQFVSDSYRLFAALNRLYIGSPNTTWYNSGPSMKYMLRQIKAMDFTLPEDPARPHRPYRESIMNERAQLSTKDSNGDPIPAAEMDVVLLVLYGHILYANTSFTNALNYFFRAYALDDQNPMILLSIALSYIHHSLKRQSENRHYHIMQGLAFLGEYRDVRNASNCLHEKQEAEFNQARIWHMLGLTHLAIGGYEKCLELSEKIRDEASGEDGQEEFTEDFGREAAVALQGIYALSGDKEMAKRVTERFLVI